MHRPPSTHKSDYTLSNCHPLSFTGTRRDLFVSYRRSRLPKHSPSIIRRHAQYHRFSAESPSGALTPTQSISSTYISDASVVHSKGPNLAGPTPPMFSWTRAKSTQAITKPDAMVLMLGLGCYSVNPFLNSSGECACNPLPPYICHDRYPPPPCTE
jgi:hypothetical protein